MVHRSAEGRCLLYVLDGLNPLLQLCGQTIEEHYGEGQTHPEIVDKIVHSLIYRPRMLRPSIDVARFVKNSDLPAIEEDQATSAVTPLAFHT